MGSFLSLKMKIKLQWLTCDVAGFCIPTLLELTDSPVED
jgi:hypothetical protein